MYPPPPPYYQPQPYDYSQQQQPYYHPQQPYFQQQPYPPPQQAQQPELQPEQPTQRAGKQTQESPRKRSHKRRSEPGPKVCPKKNWAGAEEAWLATCWCDTSEDPITGNNQKRGTLWTTVEEKFNCNDHGWVRYADALSSKWRYINKYCKDFNNIYEEHSKLARRGSGTDDEMVFDRSVAEYFQLFKRSFNMKEAWNVVRFHPKWRKVPGVQHEDDYYTASVDLSDDTPTMSFPNELFEDDPLPRPIGRNKAKKIARSSGSSDAGSASRTSARSTGSRNLQEIAEEMTNRSAAMFQAKKKAVETFTRNENLRTAMQGVQFLSIDTSHMDAKTLRAHNKMCKKIREQFADFYETDDEEEGGDEGGDEDSDDE